MRPPSSETASERRRSSARVFTMRLVILETPYAATLTHTVEDHIKYLRACMRDCLACGEAPFASHALYTQPGVLDDTKPGERKLGMLAGDCWRDVADKTVVYVDLGISRGMQEAIEHCQRLGEQIEYRNLGPGWQR